MKKRTSIAIIRWLIIIAMPFLLGLGTIRAIIAWDYPAFEYPRIASDRFGFSPEERLEMARGTLDYFRRAEPAHEVIYMLRDLRLPGTEEPLYQESEIEHMLDVKRVTDAITRIVWITGIVVVSGFAFLLWSETPSGAFEALSHGGIATTGILLAIALFILLAWNIFFVQFHQLLFPPGTWTFAFSDSLIRLFPERFWFDFGVLASASTFLEGITITAIGFWTSRRFVSRSQDNAA